MSEQETEVKSMTLTIRCKKFFGIKSGQTLKDFAAEIRELTDKDKEDLVRDFNEAGMLTVLAKV